MNRIKFKGCNLNREFPDTPIFYFFSSILYMRGQFLPVR